MQEKEKGGLLKMESNKFLLSAVIFVLGISLLGFALFSVFQPSETLTGKITNIDISESNINEEGGVIPSERAEGVCSNNECNPSNSRQICAGGSWVNCLNEKVCNFGECVAPISAGPSVKKIVYSGGGSSGGGESEVVTTFTPAEPETISSLGVVEDISEIRVKENEKATFSIGGVEQSIKAVSISPTSAATLQNGQEANFNIGDERKSDVNNDGVKDYSLRLDSINFISKEARFLVTIKNAGAQ